MGHDLFIKMDNFTHHIDQSDLPDWQLEGFTDLLHCVIILGQSMALY
jgi:hypothetical protein